MHRSHLLFLLEKYSVRYPEEEGVVTRFRDFVQGNKNCFDRELLIGHITGSAWVVDQLFSKTLLTHHKKLNNWFQPGGHADGDSDVAAVAMREAEEETGLNSLDLVSSEIFDLDIHLIPERKSEPAHYHYDCRFLIQCGADETFMVSEESNELAWIVLNEVEQYTEEGSIKRMVQKSLEVAFLSQE